MGEEVITHELCHRCQSINLQDVFGSETWQTMGINGRLAV